MMMTTVADHHRHHHHHQSAWPPHPRRRRRRAAAVKAVSVAKAVWAVVGPTTRVDVCSMYGAAVTVMPEPQRKVLAADADERDVESSS